MGEHLPSACACGPPGSIPGTEIQNDTTITALQTSKQLSTSQDKEYGPYQKKTKNKKKPLRLRSLITVVLMDKHLYIIVLHHFFIFHKMSS